MIDAAASLAAQVSIIRFTLTLPNSDLHPETAFSDVGKIRNGKPSCPLEFYKLAMIASRVTPLCWATARRIEMSVPSRIGW
jgi:hypothetical protein